MDDFRSIDWTIVEKLTDVQTNDFASLIKIAKLDPKEDFKFENWEDVDFGEIDLRDFDFTGANLRNCDLSKATFSPELLEFADTTGAKLPAPIEFPNGSSRTKIFISYAHEDKASCEALRDHLGWLFNSGQIDLFDDSQIKPGDGWNDVIQLELAIADIVIMLVSAKFTRSKYCTIDEMRVALEGKDRVIPILVSAVDFEALPLSEFQALPKDQNNDLKPINQFKDEADREQAWVDISKAIRQLIERPSRGSAEGQAGFDSAHPTLTNLPRRNSDWTGRERELEKLKASLLSHNSASICSLGGIGGVGKSSLAFEVAHRLGKNAFPDGILQFDLRGTDPEPLSAKALMGAVLHAIEPGQQLPDDVAGIYQDQLRGRKMLLILDNAKDAAQVSAMLPPEPVSVLITSRARIDPEHGTVVDLDLMAADEAMALLSKELGDKAAGTDLERLAKICGYLPLALHVAAGTIRGSRVRSAQSIMAGLADNPGKDLESVQARLSLSLDVLKSDDEALYQRYLALGIMEASFTAEMAAAVMGVEADAVEAALEALIGRSLVMMAGDASGSNTADAPRFRLHDLLRGLAKDRLDDDAAHGAGLRHAGHCRDLLMECRRLEDEGGDEFMEALRLFDRERGHIEAGQRWLSSNWADDDAAATIAADYPSIASYVVNLRLHSRDQITWFEMQAEAARHCGDRENQGNALGNLGVAYKNLGETRRAIEYHEQALIISREIKDRRGEGNALGNLGLAYADLGETHRAIEYYEEDLAIALEIGDQRGEGNALGNLGIAYKNLGETSRAIEYYEQALMISREICDRRGEGSALGNLGLAYVGLGEPRRAIEYHEQALTISREIGDRLGEGSVLGSLGLAYAALGETSRAVAYHEQALTISREIGDRRGEGNALGNLGSAYADLGETSRAIEYHEQALTISREIGDRAGEASDLGNLSQAYDQVGDSERATEMLKQAYLSFRAMDHPHAKMAAKWLRERGIDPDGL